MYLVGLLDLSPSQKTLLQRRNITPLDMSVCPGITHHYQAIERFLRYLQSRRAADNQLDWPPHDTHESGNAPSPADLVPLWKSHRHRYPGWVILPQDLRLALWHGTLASLEELPEPDTVPPAIDLQFAFELTWRMEKCLCPIFDNQLPFLEATIARYWPVTESEPSADSLPLHPSDMASQGLTLNAIRTKSHHILLALMRHYREEGLSTKWEDASQKVLSVLSTLSPDHAAQFHYERALFALFTPDIAQLKTRLVEWPQNNSLPFWAAKKAALLAEIGQVGEAQRILEQSLDTIRTKLNLTPTKADYTLVSQESFVMYLLHAVRQGSLLTRPTQSDTQSQRHEFRERWHVLKQYKCDPWQEVEIFEHKLQRPPAIPSAVAEKFHVRYRSTCTDELYGWPEHRGPSCIQLPSVLRRRRHTLSGARLRDRPEKRCRYSGANRRVFFTLGIGNPGAARRGEGGQRDLRQDLAGAYGCLYRRWPHREAPAVSPFRSPGYRNRGPVASAELGHAVGWCLA